MSELLTRVELDALPLGAEVTNVESHVRSFWDQRVWTKHASGWHPSTQSGLQCHQGCSFNGVDSTWLATQEVVSV